MKLHSLNDIFERRLFRIPDYQRGYAWQQHQLEDFWEDIEQLSPNKIHYVGVITIEPVEKTIWSRWDEDCWLIDDVGYRPFYIVDGQQRITTAMIILQAIIEVVDADRKLNYQSITDIREQFILKDADDGQRKSFLFGYEKDNPSDEFMKATIFGFHYHNNQHKHTLYTQNLEGAKSFFKSKLSEMCHDDISIIFKKLTQKLKFNLYEIDDEIDVFVTFETMNNRGKPLTSLELLKNRLIYLSTLFEDHTGNKILREKINESWKTMYEYLGKNPEKPLNDDLFLRNHWTMYFEKYSRRKGDDYIKYLLDEHYTARNVTHPTSEDDRVTVEDIDEYVTNLQRSIRHWFYIHNPYFPGSDISDDQNKMLLDRMERLGFRSFEPLLLASYTAQLPIEDINRLLEATERYNFTLFSLSKRRANTGDTEFFKLSHDLLFKQVTIQGIITSINALIEQYYDPEAFLNHIKDRYKIGKDGFYDWDGLRYFLFEYESHLKNRAKQNTNKIEWSALSKYKKDHVTIEHIFPQSPTDDYWQERYNNFDRKQISYLAHSLGNLVPLSRAKNSSLQNDSFPLKKNNADGVGYYNGSASENEIAQEDDWAAENILQRGLDLLEFMESRWDIDLGDDEFKKELLHLGFVEVEFKSKSIELLANE